MELKELRQKSIQELSVLLAKSREEMRGFRFSASAKQLKNIRLLRNVRRLIARILTIIKQKDAKAKEEKEQ